MAHTVSISFLPGTRGRIRAPQARQIARSVMKGEDIAPAVGVELVFADAATIRDLNRLYRGKDEDTDVLSFAGHEGEAFLEAPDEAPNLGEIIISVPFVERQVAELNAAGEPATVEGQLAHLLVHGLLHVMGLDHEAGESEAQEMQAREEAYLAALGYEGLYVHGH